ncbi:putative molybdopterin oxidoreductase [Magnetofaba australis IT-1]|uniref:Putative molybdopterin oxidoreductase n=1 Tax=Magnetofaba australis IT-1 TaxID=1434232 RepID=A0A1Y2K4S4_9PROT|nr:putative molybdopterin oxidoreductase [Magnetofaba australis IT-1]
MQTGADGQITKISGDPDHPFTQGVICGKVSRYSEIQHGPRILQPMRRNGPKGVADFVPISWDEALDRIAEGWGRRIEQHGAQTIWAHWYGGTMGVVQRSAVERLVHRGGFSRMRKTLCFAIAAAGWSAGVGRGLGPSAEDLAEQSDLIILWGINAVSTHINLMGFVKRARARGARLIVVDPYRTRTAKLADWHIQPRPGTDGALARALMGVMLREGLADRDYLAQLTDFDDAVDAHMQAATAQWAEAITGVPAADIDAFAREYAAASAPYIRIGIGMTRQNNGAVNLHAVSCLPALVGAWKKRGGGALLETGDAFKALNLDAARGAQWIDHETRVLDMSQISRILTDESLETPITGLLVMHSNPVGSCPDSSKTIRGLCRDDLFTVVHEQVMSDTARFADILLPATTFLEHDDLYKSYGQYTVQSSDVVVPPSGEALSNHDFINRLAQRMGWDEPGFQMDAKQMRAQMLADSGLPPLEAWPQPWLDMTPDEEARHFRNGFGHADGRFRFKPDWGDAAMPAMPDHWAVNRRDDAQSAQYPLDFMTPPAHEVLNTTFTASQKARDKRGKPTLLLHPDDAAARGIVDGERVVAYNALAHLVFIAKISDVVRPGLCLTETNYAGEEFEQGVGPNALSHADPVVPAGGPAFHDNRVEVAKAS